MAGGKRLAAAWWQAIDGMWQAAAAKIMGGGGSRA
jgi:hypothetical protein